VKLWVLSDLHVDVNRRHPLALPDPRPDHDAVVIAGDICHGIGGAISLIAGERLNAKPVVFVAGNHEFYGFDRHAELASGRAEAVKFSNIHVLERDAIEIGGVTFFGCTLWTDYNYAGVREQARAMFLAGQRLNDHRLIRNGKGVWTPQDALEEHEGSRTWLGAELRKAGAARKVVVTHHAPSPKSVQERYRGDLMTAAFASDLRDLVGDAGLWIHGHMHAPADYVQDGCRVVANPRGYVGIKEDRQFNPGLVVEVPDDRRTLSAAS
jgi:Icc-related predicted phosphoesterase